MMAKEFKTLTAIVEQLEYCEYECEGGPLKMNVAFIALKEMVVHDKPDAKNFIKYVSDLEKAQTENKRLRGLLIEYNHRAELFHDVHCPISHCSCGLSDFRERRRAELAKEGEWTHEVWSDGSLPDPDLTRNLPDGDLIWRRCYQSRHAGVLRWTVEGRDGYHSLVGHKMRLIES